MVGSSRKTSSGIVDERQGDRQALLLPAGEVHRIRLRSFAEVNGVDQLLRRHGVVEEAAEKVQQLGDGETRVERNALELHADPLFDRVGVLAHVETEDLDGARVGRPEALQDFDRGRLAGAVRAEHSEHLAPRHLEADPVDGLHVAVELLEAGDPYDRLAALGHLTP